MFRHNRYPMCMMMLDLIKRQVEFSGIMAAHVVWMKVAGNGSRLDPENPLEVGNRLGKKFKRGKVKEITNVLTWEYGLLPGEAECGLQASTTADNLGQPVRYLQGRRDITARPPEQSGNIIDEFDHRVINSRDNIPVVQEEEIRYRSQSVQRIFIANTDWLPARIAACHNQRLRAMRLFKQKMVERGIGKHYSQITDVRSEIGCKILIVFSFQQDNGVFWGDQQLSLRSRNSAEFTNSVEVPDHYGKWLVRSVFAVSQKSDGRFRAAVYTEVEPA
jgi:hypothetical protein